MRNKILFAAASVITTCVLLHCVKEPVAPEEEPHTPAKASPVTIENFDSWLSSSKVALIEFYSGKCQVCASLAWAIDSIQSDFGNKAFVGANNTDNDSLYRGFSITTVPTYIFFKNGAETARRSFIENHPSVYDTLASILQRLLADTADTAIHPDTGDTIPIDTGDTTPVDTGDTSFSVDTLPPDYLTLDESTFDSVIMRNGVTAMVFFLYSGGAPCQHMDTVIRRFAPRFEGKAIIAKVHAWDNLSLCDRYSIDHVPQYLFFRDGVYIEELRRDSIVPGDTLVAIIEQLISRLPSDRTVLLDKTNFADSVNIEGRVTMVDFFIPTCHTCQAMTATVSALADSFYGKALVAKVDCSIDDTLDVFYNIHYVPTFVFFKSGVEYYRCTGIFSFDTLAFHIREGLAVAGGEKAQ